jgi:tetratricopeptide (TPR) repeat protein
VSLGRWYDALEHLGHAHKLDPRSPLIANRLGFTLLWMRRYGEADEVISRGLEIAPTDLTMIQAKAMIHLAQGDLEAARRAMNEPEVDRATMVAYFATYWGLYWVLDDEQQQLLLRLAPSSFGGNRAFWGLILALTARDLGESDQTILSFASEAEEAFVEMLEATPDDPQLHALHGMNLALLGRMDEAIREGRRASELLPISANAFYGTYLQYQRAKIHLILGQPEAAFDLLEPLFEIPFYLSGRWLTIDPDYQDLREHPRLKKIVREHL